MPKYKITNHYSDVVVYEEMVEIQAENEDDAIEKFHEGLPLEDYQLILTSTIERKKGIWSEIQDIEEIEDADI